MMSKTEAPIQKQIREYLDKQPDVEYTRVSDRFVKGTPDILACVNGILVMIETKREEGGIESLHQKKFITRFKNVGALGGFCKSVEEVIEFVEQARRIGHARE